MSDDLKKKIQEDKDFVYSPKDGNNIDSVIRSADKELDHKKIAKLLLIQEDEVDSIYVNIVKKMQKILTKKKF